jgi:flagellar hook-length control protein FliK
MEPINLTPVTTLSAEVKSPDTGANPSTSTRAGKDSGFKEILAQQTSPVKEEAPSDDKAIQGDKKPAENEKPVKMKKDDQDEEDETESASPTVPMDAIQLLLLAQSNVADPSADTAAVNAAPDASAPLPGVIETVAAAGAPAFISNQNGLLPADSPNMMKPAGQDTAVPASSDQMQSTYPEKEMPEVQPSVKQEDVAPLPPLEAKSEEPPPMRPAAAESQESIKPTDPSAGKVDQDSLSADPAVAFQKTRDAETEEKATPTSQGKASMGTEQTKPDKPVNPAGSVPIQSSGKEAASQTKEVASAPAIEVSSNSNAKEALPNQNKPSLNASAQEGSLASFKSGENEASSSNPWTMEKGFTNLSFSVEGKGTEKTAAEKGEFAAISDAKSETGQTSTMILGDGKLGTEIRTAITEEASKNSEAALPKTDHVQIYQQIGNKAVFSLRNGEEKIRLTLDPPELGNIYMEINRDKGNIKATLWTDNPATKEILEAHQIQLQKILKDDGFKLEKFDVLYQQDAGSFQDRERRSIDQEQMKQGRFNSAGTLRSVGALEGGPRITNLNSKGSNSVDVFV